MSAADDAKTLMEQLVSLDAYLREITSKFQAAVYRNAQALDKSGRRIGVRGIYEGDEFKSNGIIIDGAGLIGFVMESTTPKDDIPDTDPLSFILTYADICVSFGPLADRLHADLKAVTDHEEADEFIWRVQETFGGKPALQGALDTYLQAGRRAYFEIVADRQAATVAEFYAHDTEYGIF